MSLKAPRNIVILGVVIAGVLACTVLLGNYVNILPAKTGDASQVKGCPAGAGKPACGMVCPQKDAGVCCAPESCPAGGDKPCCSENDQAACPFGAPKPCCSAGDCGAVAGDCPLDCTKPCCAEQTDAGDRVQGCCGAAAACPMGN